MPASIKNILIGIFVITAIGIIIFILLFLHPSVGDNAKTLHVRFNDIDKVNVGTRVTFAGKPVGEVISIHELPDARINRKTKNGDIYVYELVLKVDSGVDVFNTDVISLRTSGLLGERNIEISPQPLKQGEELKRVESEMLYAVAAVSVEDTMKQIGTLSDKFNLVLDDFHDMMSELKRDEIIAKFNKSVDNVVDVTTALNQPEKWNQVLANLLTITERVNILSNRANQSWMTVDQTINEFYATAQNADSFTQKANQIIDNTLQGKGTLGQLFVGDDLYLRLKSILHKGEVIMNDMNNYGLLFHLDKRWQRLQGRRLHLLEKLSNPNEFSKYFNQEMNQISSSLSRVSLVLSESECSPQALMNNQHFTQRFSELLRQVDNMEETLKLYNEQIVSQDQLPASIKTTPQKR